MRIESVYKNRYLIPVECEGNFHPKKELNTIEHIGLEAIALEFLDQYEAEELGEGMNAERRELVRSVLRWCEGCVDILDGYFDTYEFNGYLFGSVWMTENGIPMLTAYEIPDGCEDWTVTDWACEFPARLFRLF